MRPDSETDSDSASLDVGENGLTQILAHVIAEVRGSVSKDINGAELLYGLLNAPWLRSLLKVYESLQKNLKDPARPHVSYSSGLSLQILSDLLAVQNPSNEAQELYDLLSQPHLQALLSAHDTVSLRDYEPELPPLPKDLPEEEEAMRIICLVKNNQPLTGAGPVCRIHGCNLRWSSHRRVFSTRIRRAKSLETVWNNSQPRGSASPETSTAAKRRHTFTTVKSKRLDRKSYSAPCICGSLLFDDVVKDLYYWEERNVGNMVPHTFSQITPSSCCYHTLQSHPELCRTSQYFPTAPSNPMHIRHVIGETFRCSHTRLTKEEEMAELRRTLKEAASCMERSNENVQLLGERMTTVTKRISDSVRENSQALTMLTYVVDKLQEIVVAGHSTSGSQRPRAEDEKMSRKSISVPTTPSIHFSSRRPCSSYSSSSSSSSSSAFTLPVMSKLRSYSDAPNFGLLKQGLEAKSSRSSQSQQVHHHFCMTNGSLTQRSPKHKVKSSPFWCFSRQKKHEDKKKE